MANSEFIISITYYYGICIWLVIFISKPDQSSQHRENVISFTKEDPKRRNQNIKLIAHFDTLDQGTAAFMRWLRPEDKMSTDTNPIILKEFAHTRYSLLYDSIDGRDIRVETQNGVPKCTNCKTDDCEHVGFTILLEQKYENDGVILD
jgi:hypothetical protein